MIFLLFLCSYLPVFVTSVEYYCDTDRFPVVTDFVPEDCDNSARFYYRENVVNDCFPACVQATSTCSRYRAALEASGDHVFVSLHCDSMGNYDPLQCDVNSEQCWCVEPKTGDLTSAVLPMNLMTKLPCYNETTVGSQYLRQCESEVYAQTMITDEFNAHGTERVNFETVLCQYDGSYGPYKISSGILYCVWKDGSSIGAYQVEVSSTIGSVNCNCARDTKIYQLAGLLFSLSCRSNGNYASLQMDGNLYYCVDSDGFATTESSDDDVCPEV
ncbi:secreted modular calcium-binding protein [Holotrichia oblita]|uniref:Secreted modular calcium-binding protein n=1 Tax=Holotrichia oblita TaxID=644536 RepID=A0ACB9SKZ6_HOLOL|nr:secreted modular calcium-binding protein [Holotrichia oblita]